MVSHIHLTAEAVEEGRQQRRGGAEAAEEGRGRGSRGGEGQRQQRRGGAEAAEEGRGRRSRAEAAEKEGKIRSISLLREWKKNGSKDLPEFDLCLLERRRDLEGIDHRP
jgi:hypothetical protein